MAFPDGVVASALPAEAPKQLVIDAGAIHDNTRLEAAIEQAYDYWGRGRYDTHTGSRALGLLLETLSHDIRIADLLGPRITDAARRILELSTNQYRVMDQMRRLPRIRCRRLRRIRQDAPCGRKVQNLAASGFRTLLTCFDCPLADHLNESLGEVEGLVVANFHALCARLAREAHVALEWPVRPGDEPRFYEEVLPNTLLRVVERMGPQFDASIVDEGQDFAHTWWDALAFLLEDPERGVLYVFYDNNQGVYREPEGLPPGLVTFELHETWRNTRQIHDVLIGFYTGSTIPVPMGPDGPQVERVKVKSEASLRGQLARVLPRLCREIRVQPEDVVVLGA